MDRSIRQLLTNSKLDVDKALDEIRDSSSFAFGFNAETGEIEDLREAGIFDSTHVLISSIETALSYTKMAVETSSWATKDRDGLPLLK